MLFSVMKEAVIKMSISLWKYITPCYTLSNRRPTHWQRLPGREGTILSQCESRDFFKVTSAIYLILTSSLKTRSTRPRKERRVIKNNIEPASQSWKCSYKSGKLWREKKNWIWKIGFKSKLWTALDFEQLVLIGKQCHLPRRWEMRLRPDSAWLIAVNGKNKLIFIYTPVNWGFSINCLHLIC